MSLNSKRAIASLAAGVAAIVAYLIFATGASAPDADNLKSWATSMLVFIGIGVVALIVVQIVFHVAAAIGIAVKDGSKDERNIERLINSAMAEDEMSKLISLKSAHIGYICAGIGFAAALAALAFGLTAVCALQILFGAFALGSIAEGAASVYFFEKGVRNG
jgi:hypothetical protein